MRNEGSRSACARTRGQLVSAAACRGGPGPDEDGAHGGALQACDELVAVFCRGQVPGSERRVEADQLQPFGQPVDREPIAPVVAEKYVERVRSAHSGRASRARRRCRLEASARLTAEREHASQAQCRIPVQLAVACLEVLNGARAEARLFGQHCLCQTCFEAVLTQ
jgi:hypothetical protein